MYQEYGDRVAFYVVYIEEAHPSDGWQLRTNIRNNVVFASPKSQEERHDLATTCVRKLGIEFPAVSDDFNNSTEIAYAAWPDRIYVIAQDGSIAYKSRPGPFGFSPEKAEDVLKEIVAGP